LNLRKFITYDEVGMGQNQFRCFYMTFHPSNGKLIIHEGHSGKVYAEEKLIYSYEVLGKLPKAGGDTHGAITNSKDLVFFGGWLKAPPGLLVSSDRTLVKQDMREKYSHIHAIDDKDRVELLWSRKWDDKIPPNHWYGEVTDLVYDGHENTLYFSRADGHAELGLWKLSLGDRKAEWIIRDRTVYKLEIKDDKIFGTVFNPAHFENSSIVVYDMIENKSKIVEEFEFGINLDDKIKIKRDGGQIVQLQNKLISFYGGALVVSDPYKDKHTLYPFLEVINNESERPSYIPGLRTQKVYLMGIPIIGVNPSEGLTEPTLRTTVSMILRVDPVVPQIISISGFISGIVSDGYNVYFGTSYANHSPAYTYRSGEGKIYAIRTRELMSNAWNAIRIWIFDGSYVKGNTGIKGWFGGIPLKGFTNKKLRVFTDESTNLNICEYNLLSKVVEDHIHLREGWNTVDLSSYYDLLAFSFDENIKRIKMEIILDP
ncbi:DUF2139 domain-containing protein, partial [Sulfolobus sp. B1]